MLCLPYFSLSKGAPQLCTFACFGGLVAPFVKKAPCNPARSWLEKLSISFPEISHSFWVEKSIFNKIKSQDTHLAASTMSLTEIFHSLSDPFESTLPVLKSWTCNFYQWQRHLLCPLSSPHPSCPMHLADTTAFFMPSFYRGVPADYIFKLLPQISSGSFWTTAI